MENSLFIRPRKAITPLVIIAFAMGLLSLAGQFLRFYPDVFPPKSYLDEAYQDIFVYQFSVNTEANIEPARCGLGAQRNKKAKRQSRIQKTKLCGKLCGRCG